MASTEIIICTEKGYLESMSRLLIWSIRNFGGRFSKLPIYSYQPRKDFKISRKTIRFFERNEVHVVDVVLNSEYAHYPLANKPLATAHREYHTNANNLIFLDSDIFFLKEPEELIRFDGHDVILRPVDHKNIGTEHPGDENAVYWQELYKLLGVKAMRKVRTTSDNREILEYYNSGHLVTKTKNNLFGRWKENFIKVMKHNLKPGDLFYVEQSTFSATVSQMKLNVKQLEDHLNYPIFFLGHSPFSDYDVKKFSGLTSIHYHKKFKNNGGKNPIESLLLHSTTNGPAIYKKIKDFKLLSPANRFTKFYNRQWKRYNRLKQVLNSE